MAGPRKCTTEEIVLKLLTKHPNAPTMTLAKMLYKKYPLVFLTLESARSRIRYYRGNSVDEHRKFVTKSPHLKANGVAGFKFEIPKSIANTAKDFQIPEGKSLIMSDIHMPYHDDVALSVALEYGDRYKPDNIILNGDICDFFGVSRWEKNPLERDLSRELQDNRQFLAHLRERYGKANIVYKIGNHEERWEKYLWLKAPELCGIDEFHISKILDFEKYGITEVTGKQKMKAGDRLTLIHGHELFGSSAPVNFARTLQTNLGVCTIAGHRHSTSEHCFKTADDKNIMCWSLGCLCDMRPDYAVLNKWNHGFATMELQGDDFRVDNKRIVNGNVY